MFARFPSSSCYSQHFQVLFVSLLDEYAVKKHPRKSGVTGKSCWLGFKLWLLHPVHVFPGNNVGDGLGNMKCKDEVAMK